MSVPVSALQWQVRAEEARLEAAAIHDPQARRMMLIMAAGYERLAAHVRELGRSGLPHEAVQTEFRLRGFRGTPRSW